MSAHRPHLKSLHCPGYAMRCRLQSSRNFETSVSEHSHPGLDRHIHGQGILFSDQTT